MNIGFWKRKSSTLQRNTFSMALSNGEYIIEFLISNLLFEHNYYGRSSILRFYKCFRINLLPGKYVNSLKNHLHWTKKNHEST